MTDHPGPELLRRFALGELATAEADAVVIHLRGCAECRAELEPHLRFEPAPGAGPGGATRQPLDAYDRAIDGALASVRLHGAAAVRVRKRAHRLVAELRAGHALELPARQDEGGRQRRFPLFEAVLRYSWELRQDDPGRMIELARFATAIAPTLGADGYTPAQVADFQARAWAELANALRVGEQLARADEAIATAFEHLARGTGDELLEARLLSLQASVLASRSRFRAALEALSRAQAIHLRRGDRHHAGRALIQAGYYLGYCGLPEVALRTVDEGMAMIDAELDPGLYVTALHNRVDLLVDTRRFQEARMQLRLHRSRLLGAQGLLNRLRLKVIEGRLEAGLGNLERAERAFRTARRRFRKAGSRRLAAMASLDLAAVLMRQGRLGDARPLIEEAVEDLVAIDAAGESLTALKLLEKSREVATLTAQQVQAVADLLRRGKSADR